MDADTDDHGKEGIPLPGMDSHIMQIVVVKDTVVYPFAGSAVMVNLLIFIRTACNRRVKADIPFRFGVDAPAIGRRGAFLCAGTRSRPAAGKGQRHLRECFCLQYPQLTIRKPAMHKGVPSSSMEMESGMETGMETGLLRFVFRTIKVRMPHFWQNP